MTLEQVKKEITKMKDHAAFQVERFKDADSDDEFSQLNYYHGQRTALSQVLTLLSKINQK